MTLTNRELEPVTSCDVTLLERGRDDQWYARVPRLEPLQTAQIAWTDFSAHGSPMPPGVGPAALRFTVKCAGDKSVGLTFDR